MFKKLLISSSFLFFTIFAYAKKSNISCSILQKSDYRISIFNAGIGMPPHFINGRLHPGIELGLQKPLFKKTKKSFINYSLLIGYFTQQSLQRSFYIKPDIGYQINISNNFSLRPLLSASLMGVQQINKEYKLNDKGEYEQAPRNRCQVMPSIGLEASYSFHKSKKMQYAAFVGYQFGVQLPFSSISSILPINQLHVGIQLKKSH